MTNPRAKRQRTEEGEAATHKSSSSESEIQETLISEGSPEEELDTTQDEPRRSERFLDAERRRKGKEPIEAEPSARPTGRVYQSNSEEESRGKGRSRLLACLSIKLISTHPNRNITLCHILGAFLDRNYEVVVQDDLFLELCPPPAQFDLFFLRGTLIVYMREGRPHFYMPGEAILNTSTFVHFLESEGQIRRGEGEGDEQGPGGMKEFLEGIEEHKQQLARLEVEVADMKKEFRKMAKALKRVIKELTEEATQPPPAVPHASSPEKMTTPPAQTTPPEEEAQPAVAVSEPAAHASTSRTQTRASRQTR